MARNLDNACETRKPAKSVAEEDQPLDIMYVYGQWSYWVVQFSV